MAAAAPSLADLQTRNKFLKEEIARLKKLGDDVDSKDEKQHANQAQIIGDVEAVRKAFELFDLDKSGYIELKELANLAEKLGQPMDDKQVNAAMKEIDASGDGKISFNEFWKWWSDSTKQSAFSKLRDTLRVTFFTSQIPSLLRRLSESKLDDSLTHRVDFSIGDLTNPSEFPMSANFKISYTDAKAHNEMCNFAKIEGPSGIVTAIFQLRDGINLNQIADEVKAIGAAMKPKESAFTFARGNKNFFCLGEPAPVDPFAQNNQVNIKDVIPKFEVNLHSPLNFKDLLNGDLSVSDLLRLKFDADIQAKKALFDALITKPNQQSGAFFFSILSRTNLTVALNNFKDYANVLTEILAGPGGAGGDIPLPPPIQATLENNMFPMVWRGGQMFVKAFSNDEPPQFADLFFPFAAKNFENLTELRVGFASGFTFTLSFKNLRFFDHLELQ